MTFPRRSLWLLVPVLILVMAVLVVPRVAITEGLLESVINGALVPASQELYYVEVGDLELSFTGRSIAVSDLHLRINRQALDSLAAIGQDPAVRFSGKLDHVSFDGVDLLRLVRRRELEASAFFVRGPEFQVTLVERSAKAKKNRPAADRTGDPESRFDLSGIRDLPHVAIRRVRIEDVDASLVMLGGTAGDREEKDLENVLEGLCFELDDFVLDPTRPPDPHRVAHADDARLRFERLHLELDNHLELEIGPLTTSSRDEGLRIEHVAVSPTYTEEEFLGGAGPPGDRIEVAVGPLVFEGLPYWRIIADLDARLASGRIENLKVKVLSDKQRPSELMGEPWMPHDIFQLLPLQVAVDSLRVVKGSVLYSERGFKGQGTGSISIGQLSGTIRNLSNDPDRMTAENPMIVDAEAMLFDAVPARARLRIPLLEPAPSMLLKGWLGGFDPQVVNGILPAIEGIRVTSGEVDTAWIAVDYGREKAKGSVVVIYRGLAVRVEDRDTGEQNLGEGILSVVANIAIRGKNDPKPDKNPHVGRVNYEIPADAPFFQVFWEAISDGLVHLVANL